MSDLRLEVLTKPDDVTRVRPFWVAYQAAPSGDYDFLTTVVAGRANVFAPCVLAAFRNNEPVALLAGRMETSRIDARLGYAKLLAIPVRQMVVTAGGIIGQHTDDVTKLFLAAMDGVLRDHKLDRALLEDLSPATVVHQPYIAWASQRWAIGETCDHWFGDLPATWDEFLKRRSQKHRYWLRRLPTVLEKKFPGQVRIETYNDVDRVPAFADAAEAVACKTYHRQFGVGFIKNDETSRRLTLDAKAGRLRGYILHIADAPRAFWYCATYGRTLFLNSTGYDPDLRSFELGTILLMRVFQDHCGKDIDAVDFGLGDAGYKRRFATTHEMLTSVSLYRRNARGRGLHLLHRIARSSKRLTTYLLARSRAVQSLRTWWRRKAESGAEAS